MEPTRINLEPHEIPQHWYNVMADMPNPPTPCHAIRVVLASLKNLPKVG